jgi:hypothetical protein
VTLSDSLAVVRYESTVKIEDMIQAVVDTGYGAKVKLGPIDIKTSPKPLLQKKGAAEAAPKADAKSLAELHRTLTNSPYEGIDEQLQIELTLVTPEYLKALYQADQKTGKTKEEFLVYEKRYRLAEAIPFRVKMETHTVDTTPFDLKKAAVLIDDQGKEYSAIDWQELPSPMPAMASHHRRGILFFPRISKKESDKGTVAGLKSIEVVLKKIGTIEERRFKWVAPVTSEK